MFIILFLLFLDRLNLWNECLLKISWRQNYFNKTVDLFIWSENWFWIYENRIMTSRSQCMFIRSRVFTTIDCPIKRTEGRNAIQCNKMNASFLFRNFVNRYESLFHCDTDGYLKWFPNILSIFLEYILRTSKQE